MPRRFASMVALSAMTMLLVPPSSGATGTGRVVHIEGTHYGDVVVGPNETLRGGPRAKIVGRVVLLEGSTIEDVEVTGWRDKTWNFSAGIRIAGDRATVTRCYIHHGPSHGVQVVGGYVGVRIVNNVIEGVGTWAESGNPRYPVANWRGISLEYGSDDALISGNEVRDVWENGIFEYGSKGVVIRENTVRGFNRGRVDRSNAGSGNGIEALSDGTIVAGNHIDGSASTAPYARIGRDGIVVGGAAAIVRDNVIRDVKGSGVSAIRGGEARRIERNVIQGIGTSSSGIGVKLFAFGDDQQLGTTIAENYISAVRSAVAVWSGPRGKVDFTVVVHNRFNGLRLQLSGEHDVVAANDEVPDNSPDITLPRDVPPGGGSVRAAGP